MTGIKNLETTITSNRLRLVPMMAAHAAAMLPIFSERQLYRFTGEEPPESAAALTTRYGKLESRQSPDGSQQWLNWLVSLAESSVAIGYVPATGLESHVDIAWVTGSKWQGSGYASEAAAALVKWLQLMTQFGHIAAYVWRLKAPESLASNCVARGCSVCLDN